MLGDRLLPALVGVDRLGVGPQTAGPRTSPCRFPAALENIRVEGRRDIHGSFAGGGEILRLSVSRCPTVGARPAVLPGQVDVLPAERRDMGQEFVRDLEPGLAPREDGVAELQRVPVDDDRGQQVEAGDSECCPSPVRSRSSPRWWKLMARLGSFTSRRAANRRSCQVSSSSPFKVLIDTHTRT